MTHKPIGEQLSRVLEELEDTLWESEAREDGPHQFTQNGFRAACKIFMAAIMDKMWELQEKENMPMEHREKQAEYAGQHIHKFVKEMTNIDTRKLY